MSSFCLKLVAYMSCISFVHSIIIFNKDKFIIDTPFENIKNAVTSGNMKCGLDNEDLRLHQNKYNGTHIIFSYRQICDVRSKMDYAKKEDIYFSEFMHCDLRYVTKSHIRRLFEFNDTCSMEYDKACTDGFLGPCITSPDNSTTSSTRIVIGKDTYEFTTEEIQSQIGNDVICDPNRIPAEIDTLEASHKDYKMLPYGKQICLLKLYAVQSNIFAGVEVAARFGHKLTEEPVKKNEKFNK